MRAFVKCPAARLFRKFGASVLKMIKISFLFYSIFEIHVSYMCHPSSEINVVFVAGQREAPAWGRAGADNPLVPRIRNGNP